MHYASQCCLLTLQPPAHWIALVRVGCLWHLHGSNWCVPKLHWCSSHQCCQHTAKSCGPLALQVFTAKRAAAMRVAEEKGTDRDRPQRLSHDAKVRKRQREADVAASS